MYLPVSVWAAVPPWDRYALSVAAVALTRPTAVFTGTTAAHLHGLPLPDTPDAVFIRAATRGHPGRSPLARRPTSPGVGEGVPVPPSLAHTWNRPTVPGARAQQVRIRTAAGDDLGSAVADPLVTVHLQLAASLPLRESIIPLDRLARISPGPSGIWARDHGGLPKGRRAQERFQRACAFVDPRSESPGESLSRVLIHELGFVPPVPQWNVHAGDGAFVGRVDFWWPDVQVAGEFDGITKYDVQMHDSEEERRRAIRHEKEREVRLRRVVRDLGRWTWADLRSPARLEAELVRVGVPRR